MVLYSAMHKHVPSIRYDGWHHTVSLCFPYEEGKDIFDGEISDRQAKMRAFGLIRFGGAPEDIGL